MLLLSIADRASMYNSKHYLEKKREVLSLEIKSELLS
jgi:hypothetical protein